jgi:hypothetical protein
LVVWIELVVVAHVKKIDRHGSTYQLLSGCPIPIGPLKSSPNGARGERPPGSISPVLWKRVICQRLG